MRSFVSSTSSQAGAASNGGMFSSLLKVVGFHGDESRTIRQSHAIYISCVEQASQKDFLENLGLDADAFFSVHQMIVLHCWMTHNRLRADGDDRGRLQEAVFDRCWDDTTKRIRTLDVPELTVNKHLRNTQEFSLGACSAYDHGLATGKDELAGALYRNLFNADENIEEDSVLRLEAYTRRQVAALATVDFEEICWGRIPWLLAPGCKEREKSVWKMARNEKGEPYWWHTVTREIRLTSPNEKEDEERTGGGERG
eukprot:g184.t1